MSTWKDYQEETAAGFFRSLGFSAETDVRFSGVRSSSDIDVVARITIADFPVTWVIECKHWAEPVSKLHVFALRQIVTDLGADRGILLCEQGFQSGAVEAANFTNVQLTSLADLKVSSQRTVSSLRLLKIFDRSNACKERYWEIPKYIRIEARLRPDIQEFSNYSGDKVCDFLIKYAGLAMRGSYPIKVALFDTLMLGEDSQVSFYDPSAVNISNAFFEIKDSSEAAIYLETILIKLEGFVGFSRRIT